MNCQASISGDKESDTTPELAAVSGIANFDHTFLFPRPFINPFRKPTTSTEMRAQILSVLLLTTLILVVASAPQSDRRDIIRRIHRLLNEQVTSDTHDFRFFPFRFASQKGLYKTCMLLLSYNTKI